MCCIQAKLALLVGGRPYFQRGSVRRMSWPQSDWLKGGFAMMKSALRSGWESFRNEPSLFHLICEPSIPRIARFIRERR